MQKLKTKQYLGTGAAVLGVSLIAAIGAQAAPITTLYGTGQDAAGNTLANGVADSHYTITSGPTSLSVVENPKYVGQTATLAIANNPAWLANDPTGSAGTKWIGYAPNNANGGTPGRYVYRTTFSLTGFNSATAQITGRWAADNQGLNILLNGNSTGFTTASFNPYNGFTITSGFTSGINTLDFVLNNFNDSGGNSPTGLRVQMTGTANTAAVPEPGTMSLMALGLASLAGLKRRKKQEAESDENAL